MFGSKNLNKGFYSFGSKTNIRSSLSNLIEIKKNMGPFLVVVPLTTISNWSMEFEKWAPDIKVIIYKGKKSEREEMAREVKLEHFNVLITTYEYIMLDKSNLKNVVW